MKEFNILWFYRTKDDVYEKHNWVSTDPKTNIFKKDFLFACILLTVLFFMGDWQYTVELISS